MRGPACPSVCSCMFPCVYMRAYLCDCVSARTHTAVMSLCVYSSVFLCAQGCVCACSGMCACVCVLRCVCSSVCSQVCGNVHPEGCVYTLPSLPNCSSRFWKASIYLLLAQLCNFIFYLIKWALFILHKSCLGNSSSGDPTPRIVLHAVEPFVRFNILSPAYVGG